MFKEEHLLKAETLYGLVDVLASEIEKIGGKNIEKINRAVEFTGDNEILYKANLQLRTALNVLKEIKRFNIDNKNDLLDGVNSINWSAVFNINQSFSVATTNNSRFLKKIEGLSLEIRELITMQFKTNFGTRPNGDKFDPNIIIKFHITDDECIIYLDSSGKPLNKREYAEESGFDPLNTVIAAGIILMTQWNGQTNFINPMCGSGTLLAEGAMIAKNISPNIHRQNFSFKQWMNFDNELFEKIKTELTSNIKQTKIEFIGSDISSRAIISAKRALNRLGISRNIKLIEENFEHIELPKTPCFIITNPPYFKKLKLELPEDKVLTEEEIYEKQKHIDKENNIKFEEETDFYKMIGKTIKTNISNNEFWIFTSNIEYIEHLNLDVDISHKLFNTSLESELIKLKN